MLPNQEIRFISEVKHPLREVEEMDEVKNRTHSKKITDDFLTMAEMHRLESYWIKYGEQLPSDFDTLYATDKCDS